jgi:cyclase
MMNGFDINLARIMYNLTDKPNIIHGGAGNPQHFLELFNQVNISAAAAASIFHFTQYTPKDIKDLLKQNNIPVRNV